MQYSDSVSYDLMDPYKRACQEAGRATAKNLLRRGFTEVGWTRGESVYVVRQDSTGMLFGFVVEGLGTKNVVADTLCEQLRIAESLGPRFELECSVNIATCNAAMVFNDMSTLGVRPCVFGQHLAVGASSWFSNEERSAGYVQGTAAACETVGCCWGCGETPTLRRVVYPDASELSGASWGTCTEKQFIKGNVRAGDVIMILPSTGVHANGLTMCRDIADMLKDGYLTLVDRGEMFGEALLHPTALYGPTVEACQENGVDIHYTINVTGHGWRKFMRHPDPSLAYIIERIPKPQPVFGFIQAHGKVTTRNMYGDFNMGAGFALIVPESSVDRVFEICGDALNAGYVEKCDAGKKRVEILPIGETYYAEELSVRCISNC